MIFSFAILVSVVASGVYGQFMNCDWVNSLDCVTYNSDSECGTDGLTYANRCYYAKAHCTDNDLHILHHGDCTASETSTPTPGVNGQEAILDFFCVNLSHRDCPTTSTNEKICGTDGWTYPNYCEYEKQRCTHRNLHVASLGDCP